MPTDDLADFWVHTVSVEPRTGTGANGATFGPSVTVPCFIDDTTKLVRAASGEEVVSGATVMANKSWAASFPPNSRVTVNGRVTYVLSRNIHDSGPLGLPDHVEVALQ